ncbi:MAG: tetratricopeptide repeat protein [Planctomycetes bacterium]|nr:tetratricopeptide repeat protein [Planctomycetota bacterium]
MIEARGNYYTRIKDYDKALRDLEKVVELNPTNVEAWSNLAKMYRHQKNDVASWNRCRAKRKELGYNFDRKANEEDLIYINHMIKTARLKGIDTTELEALRDKESTRQKESSEQDKLARQNEIELFDHEKEHQELMKANAANRKAMTKDQDQWRTKWEEQQKQMLADPTPRPGAVVPAGRGVIPPDPNGPICPKCGKRH